MFVIPEKNLTSDKKYKYRLVNVHEDEYRSYIQLASRYEERNMYEYNMRLKHIQEYVKHLMYQQNEYLAKYTTDQFNKIKEIINDLNQYTDTNIPVYESRINIHQDGKDVCWSYGYFFKNTFEHIFETMMDMLKNLHKVVKNPEWFQLQEGVMSRIAKTVQRTVAASISYIITVPLKAALNTIIYAAKFAIPPYMSVFEFVSSKLSVICTQRITAATLSLAIINYFSSIVATSSLIDFVASTVAAVSTNNQKIPEMNALDETTFDSLKQISEGIQLADHHQKIKNFSSDFVNKVRYKIYELTSIKIPEMVDLVQLWKIIIFLFVQVTILPMYVPLVAMLSCTTYFSISNWFRHGYNWTFQTKKIADMLHVQKGKQHFLELWNSISAFLIQQLKQILPVEIISNHAELDIVFYWIRSKFLHMLSHKRDLNYTILRDIIEKILNQLLSICQNQNIQIIKELSKETKAMSNNIIIMKRRYFTTSNSQQSRSTSDITISRTTTNLSSDIKKILGNIFHYITGTVIGGMKFLWNFVLYYLKPVKRIMIRDIESKISRLQKNICAIHYVRGNTSLCDST